MNRFTIVAALTALVSVSPMADEYLGNYGGNPNNPNSTSNSYGADSVSNPHANRDSFSI